MDTNSHKDVLGIVVDIKIPNRQFFVWCKESESDLVLQMDQRKPVELGTWVNMRFNKSEYQNPNFLIHDYVVVTPIYKTEVNEFTVRVTLEHYLNSNLKELDHWFFGKIYFKISPNTTRITEMRNSNSKHPECTLLQLLEPEKKRIRKVYGIFRELRWIDYWRFWRD